VGPNVRLDLPAGALAVVVLVVALVQVVRIVLALG
jgi:hypothetical protein